MKKIKDSNVESIEFAVYGGICGLLGFLITIFLFFSILAKTSFIIFLFQIFSDIKASSLAS